jgi:phenylpropionate dioxygenase-like ring-hydroxylating dioxygenase large terminal subunit
MAASPRPRRPRLLKQKFGGYYHRQVPPEDAELTHVGPDTPCGEYLRRFWQPVAYGHELKDLPVKLRILGEDLVLFRDGSGRIGLLEGHCAHRGTSLEYARVEPRGIRCCYHGWHYDVDGTILEMPGEPPGSTFKDRFCHGAYPTHEYQGLIFAYLGPPERQPAFPIYDVFAASGIRLEPGVKYVMPCNWLQIEENFMDPAHLLFLHTLNSGPQFNQAYARLAMTEYHETPIGSMYVDTRRVGDNVWVRTAEQILPNLNQFPRVDEDGTAEKVRDLAIQFNWAVPIDDTHTLRLGFLCARADDPRDWWAQSTQGRDLAQERPYEERQRRPGDYEAQVGQRAIAIHALEHLGATDRGVIMFRKGIREGIEAVRRGRDPKGIVRDAGEVIPTYTQQTVLRVPPAADPAADEALLREVARRVVAGQYDLAMAPDARGRVG